MQRLVLASLAVVVCATTAGATFGMDVTFGVDGVAALPGVAGDIAVQPDDKLVVASRAVDFMRVVRYQADGTLDTDFGSGGSAFIDVGDDPFPLSSALGLQADGKIILGGSADFDDPPFFFGPNRDAMVVRLNPDGSLDTGFGTGGIVRTGDEGDESIRALVVQADDKIVAAGLRTDDGILQEFWLARYDPSGTLDSTFGAGGIVVTSATGGATDLLLQPDGKLIAVGGRSNASPDLLLVRYLEDGTLDATFGVGGVAEIELPGTTAHGRVAALQPDGKIVLAGTFDVDSGAGKSVLLARLEADGSLDATFGSGGTVRTAVGGGGSSASAVLLEPGGTIVAAGGTGPGVGGPFGQAVVVGRWDADGEVDATFAPCVQVVAPTAAIGETGSEAVGLARQSDGDLVALGTFALVGLTSLPDPVCAGPTKLQAKLQSSKDPNVAKIVWKTSAALDPAAFGDPTTTTDFQLCVLDESAGVPRLRFAIAVLGGEACGTKPCWKASTSGFKYRRKFPLPNPKPGLALKLVGTPASGKIVLKAKGSGYAVGLDETTPLDLPATIRLQRTDLAACWDGVLTTAIANDDDEFRAKSP